MKTQFNLLAEEGWYLLSEADGYLCNSGVHRLANLFGLEYSSNSNFTIQVKTNNPRKANWKRVFIDISSRSCRIHVKDNVFWIPELWECVNTYRWLKRFVGRVGDTVWIKMGVS